MEDRIAEYRKWIGNYDRPSGPQTLVSPDGWRDALRWALDEYVRLREYIRDLEQTAQRETADLIRENARLREELNVATNSTGGWREWLMREKAEAEAENARLRSRLTVLEAREEAFQKERAENARLREALERIARNTDVLADEHPSDIARNALKETT